MNYSEWVSTSLRNAVNAAILGRSFQDFFCKKIREAQMPLDNDQICPFILALV